MGCHLHCLGDCPRNRRTVKALTAVHDSDYSSAAKAVYRDQIRSVVKQGLVDVMLMSASNVEQLAMKERLVENPNITTQT